jgi:hypothetical protein
MFHSPAPFPSRRCFLALAFSAAPAFAASGSDDLELRIIPRKAEFCRGDAETGFMNLELECTLANKGRGTVAVPRTPLPPEYVRLAASEAAHEAGAFLHSFSVSWYQAAGESRPAVVTIKPGASHAWLAPVRIPLSIPVGKRNTPQPGQYWLSVVIDLRAPDKSGRRVAGTRVAASRPTPIEIPEESVFGSCKL